MAVDYKQKYLDLRSKFAKSCDRYYRVGFEEGMKEGAQQAQQEAMQQQMMMQQQAQMAEQGVDPETGEPIEGAPPEEMGGGAPPMGMPGEQPPMAPEEMGEMSPEEGSELDQHIQELESLVSKGEKPKVTDLRKAVHALTDLRKSQKAKLKSNHKEVVTSKQKQIVDNILKKWEKEAESDSVTENLEEMISSEGIKLE